MADLNAARRPVDDRSERLRTRKLELSIHEARGTLIRTEIEIQQLQDDIERKQQSIESVMRQITELEGQLLEGQSKENHNG